MNTVLVASKPQPSRDRKARWLIAAAVAAAIGGTSFSPGASAADEELELAEVTVTGSRIVRRDLEASSPIVTVGAETFENTSTVSVEGALNELPQFKPDRTQFVAGDVQATAFNTPGISSVNLRGLGSNRSLVLLDGRRAQPANATLTVDVNSIPAAAISNVEIISGGASATYGADAIAGVVNFKLKRDFEGLALDAQYGITEEGDGAEMRVSGLIGGNFGDGRGNVMVGLELARRDAVLQKDRDFFVDGWNDPFTTGGGLTTLASWNPAGQSPSRAAVDSVFGASPAASTTTNFYVNSNGSLFKQNPARRYSSTIPGIKTVQTRQGGAPALVLAEPERNGQVSSPLDRYSIFARGTFDFNENVSAFLQGNMSSFEVNQILTYAPATSFWDAKIPYDAAHPVPTELATLLNSRTKIGPGGTTVSAAADPWSFERILDYMGPRRSTNRSNVYQVLAGLEGKLGLGDWTWEAYGSYGETNTLNYLNGGFVSVERYRAVITAPNYGANYSRQDPSGGILGYKATCTTGLPVFTSFTPSQDCIDAISTRMKNITQFSQTIFEANFQGGLFDMPAGEVRAAAGLGYRENVVSFDPDVLNDRENILDRPVGLFAANEANGSTDVNEIYAEVLVPLLAGLPAIKELSLELGGRYSDYNIEGGLTTYKALLNWKFNDFVSVRGGYQRANRAPNTAELFAGQTTFVAGFPLSDPCAITTRAPWGNLPSNPNRAKVQALCSALIRSGTSVFDSSPNTYVGGNGGFFPLELEQRRGDTTLQSETATTYTAGLVLRSPFEGALSQFTASIDWYNVEIEDAISPLPGTTVYENCFNVNGTSNPTYSVNDPGGYCALIFRDPVTGGRATTDAPYSNLGTIKTSGVDFTFNWRAALADMGMQSLPGSLTAGLNMNYLIKYDNQAIPNAVFTENKGTLAQGGQFTYTTNFSLGYQLNSAGVNFNWRHLPSVRNASYATTPTTTLLGASAYDIVDMSFRMDLNSRVGLRFGIDNLLDVSPEVVGRDPGVNAANGSTVANFYDVLGRRYYAGVKLTF